jgi:N-acetylglutamate synthase-like GNAT family acetyltransferase
VGPAGVVTIRAAQPADHERLRELAFASKAHWGYEHDLVRGWADELDFDRQRESWVAEADGAIVAWAALVPPGADGVAELEDLWVDPTAMGRGLGRKLFLMAADRARELGARQLRWEAEPRSVGFYERMGAETAGSTTSAWGRTLPVMRVQL